MILKIGKTEFREDNIFLTLNLKESNDIINDYDKLNQRLKDDGFLLLRNFHNRSLVNESRNSILSRLAALDKLDPHSDMSLGIIDPENDSPPTYSARNSQDLKTHSLKKLLYGKNVLSFFNKLFKKPAIGLNFQWLRTVGPGVSSPIHSDAPFMSRGSDRILTCWTPLGDIPIELGPLVICENSHTWKKVVDTYGKSDVDRDLTTGTFSEDPKEMVNKFGGRWATTEFKIGDIVILNMNIIHASLLNMTNRLRISCDTRYQPLSDPIDSRWSGNNPKGHEQLWKKGVKLESVSSSRQRWGI